MRTYLNLFVLSTALFASATVFASHTVGGGFTYRFLGDTLAAGQQMQNYEVTLWLYQDCIDGDPGAIMDDDPAYFTIFEAGIASPVFADTSVYYDRRAGSGGSLNIPYSFTNSPCSSVSLSGAPNLCLQQKKFSRRYALMPNVNGYRVVYQRCCRARSIANIVSPGDVGITLYCDIPGASVPNSSAVFSMVPSQIACLGRPLSFDHSATDSDGDSLSYEFSAPQVGATQDDIKPKIARTFPYQAVEYYPPYDAQNPLSAYPSMSIDARTGFVTGTPTKVGRYLIKVDCHEWRNGIKINTVSREFCWVVIDCQTLTNTLAPQAGGDRTVLAGEKIEFSATGGSRYYWTPGTYLDNAFIANPVGTFTKPGEYVYRLSAVDDSGCTGTTEIKVTVLEHSDMTAPSAFTPNGDGINDKFLPIPVKGSIIRSFRVYNRWGVEVFVSNGLAPGWDGRYNDTPQPAGVYAWMAGFADTNGKLHTKSGTTILLR